MRVAVVRKAEWNVCGGNLESRNANKNCVAVIQFKPGVEVSHQRQPRSLQEALVAPSSGWQSTRSASAMSDGHTFNTMHDVRTARSNYFRHRACILTVSSWKQDGKPGESSHQMQLRASHSDWEADGQGKQSRRSAPEIETGHSCACAKNKILFRSAF